MSMVLAAFVTLCACGERSEPLLEPTGAEVVEGPLTRTPIRFGTKQDAPRQLEVEAELGHLRVPERHGAPGEREIRLRYVRFPCSAPGGCEPNHPIVYLAGGPGGSGVWSAAGDRFPLFERLHEVADVIAFDQRGTWGTEPYMVCPGSWDYPLDRPGEFDTLRRAQGPFLEECWRHWSDKADLSAYNTLESVGDLDALRRALGAEKLTLWGISYGTHLALAYIRTHPGRVHRAILAGVEGPDHTYKSPARIEAVVERVAAAIAADPAASRALPDFVGAIRELTARLEREPVTVEIDHPETGDKVAVVVGVEDLRAAVYGSLGEREDIEEMLEVGLPVFEGDFTNLARYAAESRLGNRELVMSLSMDCASGQSPERAEARRRETPGSLLGDRSAGLVATCASWPVEDLGDEYRSPLESDVPVLFISGSLDVKTPPENAEEIRRGFPNSRHLVIEGGSHDDDLLLAAPEILEGMVAFLRGGEPPERVELAPLRFRLP